MALIPNLRERVISEEIDQNFEEVNVELEGEEPLEDEIIEEPIDFFENLAEVLDEDILNDIAEDVIENFDNDKESRAKWERTILKGMDLLGLDIEDKSQPFEGACSATHPLIMENAVKFQAKAAQELLPAKGPVRAEVLGKKTPEKEAQALRVQTFMNYQLTEEMEEYYDDFESMLLYTSIIGSAFRKIHFDDTLTRPVSEFIGIDQFVVSNYARDLKRAPRYTQIMHFSPNDLRKDIASGFYKDIELGDPEKINEDSISFKMYETFGIGTGYTLKDDIYEVLEQHVDLFIEDDEFGREDGIAVPYIVTLDKTTRQILSIRRNWDEEDPSYTKKEWFIHYKFVPGFGFYGLGFIHLVGNFQMTLTAILRSLVDAGQFANLQGGFKAKGLRVVGGDDPLSPGEWRDVEAQNMDLSKALMPVPYKEPSATLMNMLSFMDGRGQKFADATEAVISDASNYGPVGTTMALIEQSTKFFSGVHKRMHAAQRKEFKILARINSEFLSDNYPYEVVNGDNVIAREDFTGVSVIPVADPNITSKAERLAQAHMKFTIAQQMPQYHDMPAVIRRIYVAMDEDNIEELMAKKAEPKPQDPISDIMAATKGAPIQAFQGQNHDAHIKVKKAWLEDPMGGSNPAMQTAGPIVAANIQEHLVMRWQEMMGGLVQTGGATDPQTAEMIMGQAAEEVLAFNKMHANEEQMTDQQLKNRELDIKEGELLRKWQEMLGKQSAEDRAHSIKEFEALLKEDAMNLDGLKATADILSREEVANISAKAKSSK